MVDNFDHLSKAAFPHNLDYLESVANVVAGDYNIVISVIVIPVVMLISYASSNFSQRVS